MTKVKADVAVPTAAPATRSGAAPSGAHHPSPADAGPAVTLAVDLRGLRDERKAGVASPVIDVRGMRMNYGPVEALSGIDLEVHLGEVFAFLGPNGAGKTTTVEILEGLRHRSGGEVWVLGEDPARAGGEWRARIGVVLQESEPEPELTVEECMSLYAGYYPRSRPVRETLDLVGLADRPTMRCGQLSGGQRRRLDVALALIGDPELLFLDEPTTGFDPSARRAAWDVISGLRALGKTIFLTTHYMEEAEYLADRIAVIAKGQIVAEGDAAGIAERGSRHRPNGKEAPAHPSVPAKPLPRRTRERTSGRPPRPPSLRLPLRER